MMRPLALVLAVLAAFLAPPPSTSSTTRTYVATTLNERNDVGPTHARRDLRKAATGSDLLYTQENSRRRVRAMLGSAFAVDQPWDAGRPLALAWRRDTFTRVGSYPVLLHHSHMFGSATRYVYAVELRPRANPSSCLLAVVMHMIPHIERAGHPRPIPRRRLVGLGLTRLTAWARSVGAHCSVLIGGDWNIDGYADRRVRDPLFPARRFAALGYGSSWQLHTAATLGSRHVDGFYFDKIEMISARTLPGFYSDHNANRLTIRMD